MKRTLWTAIRAAGFYLVWLLFAGFFSIKKADPALIAVWRELPQLICVVVLTIALCIVDRKEMTFPIIRNLPGGMITGSFFSAAWIGIPVLALFLMKHLTFAGINEADRFWTWALALLIHSTTTELLFRGYVYHMIKGRHNGIAAFGVTTILYILCQPAAWNEGIVAVGNLILMSVLITLLMEVTGNVMTAILANAGYYIFGGLVLNALRPDFAVPNIVNVVLNGSEYFTGGSCYLAGNVIMLAVNAVLVIMFASVRLMQRNTELEIERAREAGEELPTVQDPQDDSSYLF